MNNLNIKSNGRYREILYWNDLTPEEQTEYTYYKNDQEDFSGFRYKGQLYELSNFMRTPMNGELFNLGWQGVFGITYFSSVLVQYSDCGDFVKVGYYYS